MNIETIASYGDILAIIGFSLLVVYFYKKEMRTPFENLLFLFSVLGLMVDSFLTVYRYLLT